MWNDFGVCCAHEGKTGTDESAQVLTQQNWKMVLHPVSTGSRTHGSCFYWRMLSTELQPLADLFFACFLLLSSKVCTKSMVWLFCWVLKYVKSVKKKGKKSPGRPILVTEPKSHKTNKPLSHIFRTMHSTSHMATSKRLVYISVGHVLLLHFSKLHKTENFYIIFTILFIAAKKNKKINRNEQIPCFCHYSLNYIITKRS